MIHTANQLKALVRNMSQGDSAKALLIFRKYMMERFLERLSISPYRSNLIIKGGVLIAAVVGLDNRSTMDIDTTIKNLPLSEESVKKAVEEITAVRMDDGVDFEIKSISLIMEEDDYPGIRVMLTARLGIMNIPLKIDFSTNDVITPHEISYAFKLLFEERSISILTYTLETVLAEKIETFFARGTANTRMRDFYDIFILDYTQGNKIDKDILKTAFFNTSKKRGTVITTDNMDLILKEIDSSSEMAILWKNYQRKFDYAANVSWSEVMHAIKKMCEIIKP